MISIKKLFKVISLIAAVFCLAIFSLIIFGNIFLPDSAMTNQNEISYYGIYSAEKNNSTAVVSLSKGLSEGKNDMSDIKLFGAFPVKNISLQEASRRYVITGGDIIGIRLKTNGVLIVGTESVECEEGTRDPAAESDIRIGDTLVSVDGTKISSNEELSGVIESSEGKTLRVELIRDSKKINTTLTPVKSKLTQLYKCGLWIRDSTGGIGTLTYKDPVTGAVATLGHGIYDVDTNKLIPCERGSFYSASLSGIKKGIGGSAGELKGSIGTDMFGEIFTNCENGIYGFSSLIDLKSEFIPVAYNNEIKTGKAQIISTVTGNKKEYYDINIEKVNFDSENKNMIIKVTDSELLDITGGIVQGMSGSPIIQNGMLVGAVTHVFVSDPTKGYAIFAENMISTADEILKNSLDRAS